MALSLAASACTSASTASTTNASPTTTVVSHPNGSQTTTSPPPVAAPNVTSDVVSALGAYFDEPTAANRDAAASVLQLEGTTSEQMTSLLPAAINFPAVPAGRETIVAPIGFNRNRQIRIRTPLGYDPSRSYPTIVAYHTWGGTADRMLDRVEDLLGDAIENYIVAAPDDYRQTVLDAPPPVSAEHVAVWDAVKRARNVDSDRFYLMGYSLGGETVMTTAAMHGQRIAAGIGMANTFAFPPDVVGLWEAFVENIRNIPLLHVWGDQDTTNIPGLNFRDAPEGLAELNRRFGKLAADMGLDDYTGIELPGVGHGGVALDTDRIVDFLSVERRPVPTEINHSFRYIHQADTAWVEGHEWEGTDWLDPTFEIKVAPGESEREAEGRVIAALLGSIRASAVGNSLEVTTTHLSDLTVWLTDDLVEFGRPITVIHNGVEVFSGMVTRDYGVALIQAERNYDFARIRWAGIRIVDGKAHVVTTADAFPDIAREIRL
jgi:pimeloyl-ACP methyl ester carboxylesterase